METLHETLRSELEKLGLSEVKDVLTILIRQS